MTKEIKNKEERKGIKKKEKIVARIAEKIKNSRTVMIVSIGGLPSKQFQEIRKKIRGKAEIELLNKNILIRAIDSLKREELSKMKKKIKENTAVVFSEMDAFELAAILSENKIRAKAKEGQKVQEDVKIEAGPTDLAPGPAISELGSLGLKVAVEDGKIAIKESKVILKKGEIVSENAANIMGKLDILPFEVGIIPVAAYDSKEDKLYVGIKVDKEGTLEELKEIYGKTLGLALKIGYLCKETIGCLIGKAGKEAKILERFIKEEAKEPGEVEEEKPGELGEEKTEETKEVQENKSEEEK